MLVIVQAAKVERAFGTGRTLGRSRFQVCISADLSLMRQSGASGSSGAGFATNMNRLEAPEVGLSRGFSEQGLELGEDLLDRVEVRAVGRQEEQLRSDAADEASCGLPPVAAEIVDDHDIAGPDGGQQDLRDIRLESSLL